MLLHKLLNKSQDNLQEQSAKGTSKGITSFAQLQNIILPALLEIFDEVKGMQYVMLVHEISIDHNFPGDFEVSYLAIAEADLGVGESEVSRSDMEIEIGEIDWSISEIGNEVQIKTLKGKQFDKRRIIKNTFSNEYKRP